MKSVKVAMYCEVEINEEDYNLSDDELIEMYSPLLLEDGNFSTEVVREQ